VRLVKVLQENSARKYLHIVIFGRQIRYLDVDLFSLQ